MMDYKNIAWISMIIGVIIFSLGLWAIFEDIVYYFKWKVLHTLDILRVSMYVSVGLSISIAAWAVIYL
jgi:hypothetical protein